MWQNEPGVFEMMMKFFYLYNEDLKHNVKSFELSCRDFLEDVFMHYEKCAIKGACSCCEKVDDTIEEPVDVGGESVPDIKKEKDEIIEIPEAADFSGFVLSPEWHEPPQPSPAPEPPEHEANPNDEEMKAQAMLSEPQMDVPIGAPWSCASAATIHFPSRIVHELGVGLKRNPTKRCRLCYRERRARRETRYWCRDCPTKPGLCIEPCFRIWHQTKLTSAHLLSGPSASTSATMQPETWGGSGVTDKSGYSIQTAPVTLAPNR